MIQEDSKQGEEKSETGAEEESHGDTSFLVAIKCTFHGLSFLPDILLPLMIAVAVEVAVVWMRFYPLVWFACLLSFFFIYIAIKAGRHPYEQFRKRLLIWAVVFSLLVIASSWFLTPRSLHDEKSQPASKPSIEAPIQQHTNGGSSPAVAGSGNAVVISSGSNAKQQPKKKERRK